MFVLFFYISAGTVDIEIFQRLNFDRLFFIKQEMDVIAVLRLSTYFVLHNILDCKSETLGIVCCCCCFYFALFCFWVVLFELFCFWVALLCVVLCLWCCVVFLVCSVLFVICLFFFEHIFVLYIYNSINPICRFTLVTI